MGVVPAGASVRQGGGGGELVLGAEQEPDCADWIASCAGASWGVWTMMQHTMPRVFDIVNEGGKWIYRPSILVAAEPTAETVAGKQVVTYPISDAAVWSDGEPITSSDFKYTWDQIANTEDVYDRTGYDRIESVDDSDAKVAVVTFKEAFSGWRGLFGGGLYGVMPSHLLEGKNRSKLMKDGYAFSGGPFRIEGGKKGWRKGVSVTLVPNENYWGPKPKLDRVVFKFLADTAAEFQAFKAGEVLAIYPQPQLDAIEQIEDGIEGADSILTAETGNVEALWINNAAKPFDSVTFRQAFAYAIDRNALVARLFGGVGITSAVNSLNPPILADFSDQNAFASYELDLAKVDELMEGDGWEKGSDGIWEKGRKRAEFVIKSTTLNQRRELTEQILQQQLLDAGFEMTIKNEEAGDLFGKSLPAGKYQVALYAQVETDLDPGLCSIFCSTNIPSKKNKFSGINWTRTNIEGLDPLLEAVDTEIDDVARAEAAKEADRLLAQAQTSLPLDPLPNISLWSTRINGVNGDNPVFALFWNLHEWSLS